MDHSGKDVNELILLKSLKELLEQAACIFSSLGNVDKLVVRRLQMTGILKYTPLCAVTGSYLHP